MKINVMKNGAKGDGITNDTRFIQTAIDKCSENGGEVIFEKGIYICGTLQIKSNITLIIEKDAVLMASGDFLDYPDCEASFIDAVVQKRGKCFVLIHKSNNVNIKGEGIICGRGALFDEDHPNRLERPFLLRIIECNNIKIEGVKLCDSPAWCLHMLNSDNITIKGIEILNRVNENNDGIDIDACRNIKISDCDISTGDDALCLKATINRPCENIQISNCRVSSNWAAFKIGTESVGDFRNIEISDCYFYDVYGAAIKIVPVDGGIVENVKINNIFMNNCTGPIFISLGERLRKYLGEGKSKPGYINNIEITNIKADVINAKGILLNGEKWGNAKGCIVISGIETQNISGIIIKDCEFLMPGGFVEKTFLDKIPEMGKQYPEFHLFGDLPAYAFYIRYAENILIENTNVKLKNDDIRQELVCENAYNIKVMKDRFGCDIV